MLNNFFKRILSRFRLDFSRRMVLLVMSKIQYKKKKFLILKFKVKINFTTGYLILHVSPSNPKYRRTNFFPHLESHLLSFSHPFIVNNFEKNTRCCSYSHNWTYFLRARLPAELLFRRIFSYASFPYGVLVYPYFSMNAFLFTWQNS